MQHNASGHNGPTYTLHPDKLLKAKVLTQVRVFDYFGTTIWTMVALTVLLHLGVFGRWRDYVQRTTSYTVLQGLIVLPLLIVILFVLPLPFEAYEHHLQLAYHLSIQPWSSWITDRCKELLLSCVTGTLILSLLFFVVRRFPRRWWLVAWAATIPLLVFSIFISPLLVDPWFNQFEPLEKTAPALVTQLEQVVAKGGLSIPPSRMYLMKASAKVTTVNAYVTGIGSSARLVVWDTALQKTTPDIVLSIFGHEMGHFVLHHVRNTIVFLSLLLLFVYWAGRYASCWLIARWGTRWQVRSTDDWAAFGVYALVFTVLSFAFTPVINAYSRMQEHAADVYSMEILHGVLPDPPTSAVNSFCLLGEQSLADPNPSAWIVWLLYSHPSISQRVTFAAAYHPWSANQSPEYFSK